MLRLLLTVVFLSNSLLNLVKTQEVLNTTATLLVESSTASNVQSSTLENLPSTASSTVNTLQDIQTTSSWELIYPDQNSTTTGEPPSVSKDNNLQTENATLLNTQSNPANPSNLPKYFKVDDVINCQKYFGACLRQVLASVLPKLKNGSQALQIPSLDPVYFNQTAFQFNNGPFTGHITMRFARIYGLTAMKFNRVDYNSLANSKFKARLSIIVPKMKVFGSYKGDLVINNLAVRPKGNFNISMLGLHLDVLCLGAVYKREEHKFLKFTKNNVTANFKDSKVNATGIFPDQRLNEVVVNVANQYWRELFNVVIPETRRYWSPILMDALNGALSMVPFDFLT